jgi:hypothetical protein
MVHNLALALALQARGGWREVVVSRDVFRQVLEERQREGEVGSALLNRPYDSPKFRFLHSVRWRGKLFIHLSREALTG